MIVISASELYGDRATRRRVPARVGGIVVPHRSAWRQGAVAWLVVCLERWAAASWRCRWQDRSGLLHAPDREPVIFCLWHNRLALSMVVHRRYGRRLVALISASRDGALLASVLEKYGVRPVRGSSSRRGPQALLELANRTREGCDVAITPDGPRGPRYVVQRGIMDLAQVTGLPIVPVTCQTGWKVALKSWDRFQIPLPFARCEIVLNEPIRVPRHASDADRDRLCADLESSMRGAVGD